VIYLLLILATRVTSVAELKSRFRRGAKAETENEA
jgi:hypothetical protein